MTVLIFLSMAVLILKLRLWLCSSSLRVRVSLIFIASHRLCVSSSFRVRVFVLVRSVGLYHIDSHLQLVGGTRLCLLAQVPKLETLSPKP